MGAASALAVGTPSAVAASPRIDWAPCADDAAVDCGTLAVPLDYAHPHGPSITLAMERRPADDSAHKLGSIFVNPGGPGVSGLHEARNAAQRFGSDVLAHFDVIGFDPRGVGASTPLQCFTNNDDPLTIVTRIMNVPITPTEVSTDLEAFREYTAACGVNAGPLRAHMSTLNVARDLDQMRQAVGEAKLDYAGYSYGTLLGATYANLFPSRVGRMILDGPEDDQLMMNDRAGHLGFRAAGAETMLDSVLAACQQAGSACPFFGGGRSAEQKFARLRDRLRTGPIGDTTISNLVDGIATAAFNLKQMLPLATWFQQLYDAAFGSGSAPTARPAAAASPAADEPYKFNGTDSWLGTYCTDGNWPRSQAAYPRLAATFERFAPTFGRWIVYNDTPCATYPVTDEQYYGGPWNRPTAPILVVAMTHDMYTPYPGAVRLTHELADARLLTVDGYGHPSQNSTCSRAARDTYLISGTRPAAGARCAQDSGPFPG
ncbi:MAG TPA: alpha/beta fold hydrolase [Jatrophihabitantaceae bacterium]